jgi:hypothetical protein
MTVRDHNILIKILLNVCKNSTATANLGNQKQSPQQCGRRLLLWTAKQDIENK